MENNTTKPFINNTIPSDWELKTLKSVAKKITVGIATEVRPHVRPFGIPIIRNQNIRENYFDDHEIIYISEEFDQANKNKRVKKGDVLIVRTGSNTGQACIVPYEYDNAQTFTTLIVRTGSQLDSQYLSLHINSFGVQEVERLSVGGGKPNLNAGFLNQYKILLPPLKEQLAIANVLSLMDSAINQNNQLIAQKELRKKWLMQNLLTGKKRLKGFGGEWKDVKLGKLFKQIKNINDGGDTHSIMTISSKLGLISQEDKFDRVIAGDSLKKYTQLKKEDFAYNKGNSKTYQMGCIYQLEEAESALVPFVYICFSPTDLVDTKFYKHWFLAHGLDRQLKKIITSGARGDGLLNVNTDDFFNLRIPYPPKEEQTAIAQVLQAADKEIQLLKAKTDKLREQKKGMMQVLLTGKKRLKIGNKENIE